MTTTEEAPTKLVEPVRRVEDASLITGAAKYLDDLKLPGMTHVAILRSPYAHARIKSIETSKAEAAPGVVGVFGQGLRAPARPAVRVAGGSAENFVSTPRALEIDRVTFTGAGVAAVVAESRYAAEDALELIEVDWEPLDVVVDVEEAAPPRVRSSCTRTRPATSRWTGPSATRRQPTRRWPKRRSS